MRTCASPFAPFLFRSLLPLVVLLGLSACTAHETPDGEWRSYGRDPGGMRHSPLDQIHRDNVVDLERAWTYHTGEVTADMRNTAETRITSMQATPLMVDGVLYFSTITNRVVALEAETGRELWTFDPFQDREPPRRFMQHRGVAYWEEDAAEGPPRRRIFSGTFDGRLFSLDAETGRPDPDFGEGGRIDLRQGVADAWPDAFYAVTSPPAVYGGLVITGAAVPEYPSQGPSGNVRAWDVLTGAQVWEFHSVPRPGEPGHETWEGDSWRDRTGVNVWTIMSVDDENGIVYLPFGSPASDFYGGDRVGENLFGNSLVALDAETGRRLWHYQLVRHDLWDYDLPAHPNLVTLEREGKEVPAVVQVTKMGLVFVFNRLTGEPLFPIEEVSVPASDVPGEAAWPTQPVPTAPPPLSRQTMTREEVNRLTPESYRHCLELFDTLVTGPPYTPHGLRQTLVFPGTLGGATWSGAAFDPESGLLFVNVNNVGAMGAMVPQPEDAPLPYRRWHPEGGYARFWDPRGWPCQEPPWGVLHAVDLNRGRLAWSVPLGFVEELVERGLPPTGTPNLGGPIVTAGGLVFIGGSNDRRFRAFDSSTGRVLWETELEASGHATPMTFLGPGDGRQYVVISASGGGYFSERVADALVAFALPEGR